MSDIKLYLGDCIEYMRSMPDESVDAVITDPPYGIGMSKTGCGQVGRKGFVYGGRFTEVGAAKIDGDSNPDGEWLQHCYRILRDNGILYSFSRWDVDREWHILIESAGFSVSNRIAWVKANWGSGDLKGAFGFQYESIWRASKGRSLLRVQRSGDVWRDAWTECVRHGKVHPNEKPVDLLERCVLSDTGGGDTVFDPFMGSGSTGIACVNLNRNFIGCEINTDYFKIAEQRIAQAQADLGQVARPLTNGLTQQNAF